MNRHQRRSQKSKPARARPKIKSILKGGSVTCLAVVGPIGLLKDFWSPCAAIAGFSLTHIWAVPAWWLFSTVGYGLIYDAEKQRQRDYLNQIRLSGKKR